MGMKHLVIIAGILALAAAASAQQVEFSSSLNPVGSGARATGMGGAFIAVADDATAASWNPAGLVQLEKSEVSAVVANFSRDQKYHSTDHPEINGSNSMNASGINFLSAAAPFVLFGRNTVASISYQRLYEMNKHVTLQYVWPSAGIGDSLTDDIDFKQDGYLYAVSPAIAMQVTPNLYLGLTLNIWKDLLGTNGWENTYHATGNGTMPPAPGTPFSHVVDWKNTVDFEGYNANLGVMWSPAPRITLGGVFKTAFDADLTEKTTFSQTQADNTGTVTSSSTSDTKDSLTMKMPASYGAGIQYRHSDSLILAFDVYRTLWSQFLIRDSAGNEINPLNGAPISDGKLSDTTQLRFGAEYLFIGNDHTIALRGGLFSDPEPGIGSTDKFTGFSLGTGYSTSRFSVDASYQLRQGKNVDGDIAYIQTKSTDITQGTLMLSGIYYF